MNFRPQSIIRHIKTHKPFLVIRSYKTSTLVADLESRDRPTEAKILLERDYDEYIDERKLSTQEKKGILEWSQAVLI